MLIGEVSVRPSSIPREPRSVLHVLQTVMPSSVQQRRRPEGQACVDQAASVLLPSLESEAGSPSWVLQLGAVQVADLHQSQLESRLRERTLPCPNSSETEIPCAFQTGSFRWYFVR